MRETETGLKGFRQLRHVVMELPKYKAGEHPKSHIDKWAYFFRMTDRLTKVPKELSNETYQEAFEVTRIANMTEEEYDIYEQAKMAEQDEVGRIQFAQDHGFERGKQEGLEAGRQEKLQSLRTTLLSVISARGFHLSPKTRIRIKAETDIDVVSRWIVQATTATTLAEALH